MLLLRTKGMRRASQAGLAFQNNLDWASPSMRPGDFMNNPGQEPAQLVEAGFEKRC